MDLRTLKLTTAIGLALALPAWGDVDLSVSAMGQILGGRPIDALEGKDRAKSLAWYSQQIDRTWQRFDQNKGDPMSAWAAATLEHKEGETIFYPFGGPDFVTVHRLYPKASRYILVGLEKGGRPPQIGSLSTSQLRNLFRVYLSSMRFFSSTGFFVTRTMREEFGQKTGLVEGITGVLALFADREGYEVVSLEPVRVNQDGSDLEVHPGPRSTRKSWDSLRLTLRERATGRSVILDYLMINLSNAWLKNRPADQAWLESMCRHRIFLKAASHLLQTGGFTIVRDMLLNGAQSILQDETGLSYHHLNKRFHTRLYGRFVAVHTKFSDATQRGLREAYRHKENVGPLPFKISYDKKAGSCLQYAHRRRP